MINAVKEKWNTEDGQGLLNRMTEEILAYEAHLSKDLKIIKCLFCWTNKQEPIVGVAEGGESKMIWAETKDVSGDMGRILILF